MRPVFVVMLMRVSGVIVAAAVDSRSGPLPGAVMCVA